eukprot:scaffold1403_cov180-Ochromonas_danica.AAC.10
MASYSKEFRDRLEYYRPNVTRDFTPYFTKMASYCKEFRDRLKYRPIVIEDVTPNSVKMASYSKEFGDRLNCRPNVTRAVTPYSLKMASYSQEFGDRLKFRPNVTTGRVNMKGYSILVRDSASWWEDDGSGDFSGPPYHITSLPNAFGILISGHIRPSPGQYQRFGENSNVIYFGFPDFNSIDFSTYGSVSFGIAPNVLFGVNPQFHYRYTVQYDYQQSHLFLLSNGGELPNVALQEYDVGDVDNGIWWINTDADGNRSVHFTKSHKFEFIEFAVLRNGIDDGIPLKSIDHIRFQKKIGTLGNDRKGFNKAEEYLILSLALYYLGDIPDHILSKFGSIDVCNLYDTRKELMEAFEEDLGGSLLTNPFGHLEFIANKSISSSECPTFAKSIHYLRQKKSWMLKALRGRIEQSFDAGIAAIKAHNEAVASKNL